MTDISLKYLLFGEDRTASKSMKGLAGESAKTGSSLKTSVVAGAAVASAAIVAFGKSSVDKFKEVGGQTQGLMRIMGGTAEEASRLRFAADQSGVSYETLSKSTGKFEKALGASLGSGKATSAMIKTLGFDFRDAQGHVKPMSDILPQLSDKFLKMPAGAEKTALAMQLFGKSGADMLPFLNKGSSAIAALEKQSDKYGLTLTGSNLDALKKSKASQREWNASLQGLQVQFGAQILPLLTSFTSFVRGQIIPVVIAVTTYFQTHKNMLVLVATAIGLIITAMTISAVVTKASAVATNLHTVASGIAKIATAGWAAAQWLLNAAMSANPIVLVVLAIVGLIAIIVLIATKTDWFQRLWSVAFHAIQTAAMVVWNWVRANWPLLLAILTGPIGIAVLIITRNWGAIKQGASDVKNWIVSSFNNVVSFFSGLGGRMLAAGKAFMSSLWTGIRSGVGNVGGFVADIGSAIRNGINGILHLPINIPRINTHIPGIGTVGGETLIPALAKGGVVTRPTVALFGEAGPEAVIPLNKYKGGFGGGGDVYNINITHPLGTDDAIVRAIVPVLQRARARNAYVPGSI
ncbi:phage tail tape measure protein [Jatrophihabitans sp. DSM 45814]